MKVGFLGEPYPGMLRCRPSLRLSAVDVDASQALPAVVEEIATDTSWIQYAGFR